MKEGVRYGEKTSTYYNIDNQEKSKEDISGSRFIILHLICLVLKPFKHLTSIEQSQLTKSEALQRHQISITRKAIAMLAIISTDKLDKLYDTPQTLLKSTI